MFFKFQILLLTAFCTYVLAFEIAVRVPQALSQRTVNSTGGWALNAGNPLSTSNATCPADNSPCGLSWCCPNSLTCFVVRSGNQDTAGVSEACCPSDDPGSESVCVYNIGQVNAVCADDSWVLWNATTALEFTTSGYFCCLPGQIGCQDGTCVEPDAYSAYGTPSALLVSGTTIAAGGGGATATATTTTKGGTGKATATTTTATSTSSLSASATGKSEGVRHSSFGILFVLQVLGAVGVAVFL